MISAVGRPCCVTHLAEASSPGVGNFCNSEADVWEQIAARSPSDIHVRSTTARGGVSGFLQRSAMVGLGSVLALAGGRLMCYAAAGAGFQVAGAVALALGAAVVTTSSGLVAKGRTWAQRMRLGSVGPERVQRMVVKKPSARQIADMLLGNMKKFPAALQIVHVSGHGDGTGAAMIPFSQLGPAVHGSDVVLVDACCTAQLEAYSHLAPYTQVVVGTPYTMRGWGLPLTRLFGGDVPQDPRALGAMVVDTNKVRRRARAMVAVNMPALGARFLPALDDLGRELLAMLENGGRAPIRRALHKSKFVGLRSSRVDLGSFLQNLRQQLPQSEAVRKAQEAWKDTVIAQHGKAGVTCDLVVGRKAEQLPLQWRAFLCKLRRRTRPLW